MTKSDLSKTVTLVLYAGMLLSFFLWQGLRPQGWSWLLLVIQCIPLLIFIPGLRKNNPRAYIGLCFVLLLYFIKGVEGVFSPARTWFDASLIFFSVTLFISSMLTSRWLQVAHIKPTDI